MIIFLSILAALVFGLIIGFWFCDRMQNMAYNALYAENIWLSMKVVDLLKEIRLLKENGNE